MSRECPTAVCMPSGRRPVRPLDSGSALPLPGGSVAGLRQNLGIHVGLIFWFASLPIRSPNWLKLCPDQYSMRRPPGEDLEGPIQFPTRGGLRGLPARAGESQTRISFSLSGPAPLPDEIDHLCKCVCQIRSIASQSAGAVVRPGAPARRRRHSAA